MGKLLVNGAIEATSHISIKNGADLYLQAPSNNTSDSGDLVFTTYDGTEQGRIWINGGVGMIRFSSSDSSKTLIHSGNIGSQSVNYASSAGNTNLLDSIDSTGFLRYYNGNNAGLTNADIVNTPSYLWTVSTTGGTINTSTRPSGMDNAWGVLHIHTHIGSYATQLGFGGTTGNLYFRNAYASDTFDSWKTLIHSGNISSQSVNYATSAGYSTYLNTVAGNEIRFHNATGLTAGGSLWLGWAWADGNKTVTKDWYIGNFSGGGLANIYASTFNGSLNGNATSATYASYVKDSYNGSNITITYGKSGQSSTSWLASWNGYELGAISPANITAGWASGASASNAVSSTGWGNGTLTYLQTSGSWYGNSGWSHYIMCNHGSGETYYNYTLALPFWDAPMYQRQTGNTSSRSGWHRFHTTENVLIQSSTPGAGFYGQIWLKI